MNARSSEGKGALRRAHSLAMQSLTTVAPSDFRGLSHVQLIRLLFVLGVPRARRRALLLKDDSDHLMQGGITWGTKSANVGSRWAMLAVVGGNLDNFRG